MVPLRARIIDSDYPLGYVPWASGLMIRIVLALPVEPAGLYTIPFPLAAGSATYPDGMLTAVPFAPT